MCNNCEHKPVCSIYRATGGVKSCEHHKEERRGRWLRRKGKGLLGREYLVCSCCESINPLVEFNYCFNCGADMRRTECE
jgi:hypothetical protein